MGKMSCICVPWNRAGKFAYAATHHPTGTLGGQASSCGSDNWDGANTLSLWWEVSGVSRRRVETLQRGLDSESTYLSQIAFFKIPFKLMKRPSHPLKSTSPFVFDAQRALLIFRRSLKW